MNAGPPFLAGILATLAAQWAVRVIRRAVRRISAYSRPVAPAPRLYPSLNDPCVWPKRRRKAR